MFLKQFCVAILILLAVGCSSQSEQAVVADEVVAVEQAFMAAFEYADATGISKLYTEQAQLLPSNRDFVSGRHEIKLFWQGLMQLGIASIKLETLEVEYRADQAFEVGRYTIHTADDEMIDYGKYLVIWQYQEEQWFIHRHIWTTSMLKIHESRI